MTAPALPAAQVWSMVAAERHALAEDLADLENAAWAQGSLCGQWRVEEVVAHLSAAASIGPGRWLRSVLGARFDFGVHNQRRLEEHLGPDPAGTLARFRSIIHSTTSTWGEPAVWLGEVVVHAQDIRRPLGLTTEPSAEALSAVAHCFARKDYTVPGKTMRQGLRLEAGDSAFAVGEGPVVSGPTLALVMVMAERPAYLADLEGPGLPVLRERLRSSSAGL